MVTQVVIILQHWWEFKVLVKLGLKRLSSRTNLLWYNALFKIPISSWKFQRISGNGRRRNADNFQFFFFSREVTVIPSLKSRFHRKNLKKFLKRLPTMFGLQKMLFLECLKWLFHHYENSSSSKKLILEGKVSIQRLILFRKIRPCKLTLQGAETLSAWS